MNIIFGGIATALTVTPAVGGKTLLDALGDSDPDSSAWRALFALAALFSLLATISASLYKAWDLSDRIAKAQACSAKLEGLDTLLGLGQIPISKAGEAFTQYISDIEFIQDEKAKVEIGHAKGKIKEPTKKQVVGKTINCSGWAEDLAPGLHLWLATEVDDAIWPKEGAICVDETGAWERSIFEDGTAGEFSLSLFVADDGADRKIRDWLRRCNETREYKELRRPSSGLIRIDRVDGLTRGAQS